MESAEPVKKPKRVTKKDAEAMTIMEEKKKAVLISDEQLDKLAEIMLKKLDIKPEEKLVGQGVVIPKTEPAPKKPEIVNIEPVAKPRPPPIPEPPQSRYGRKFLPPIIREIPKAPPEPEVAVKKQSRYGMRL